MKTKTCNKCKIKKPLNQYNKNQDHKDGLGYSCKSCIKKYNKNLSPGYYNWTAMKYRCSNPNNQDYKYYGGRGIKVCKRWRNSFDNFLKDMGPKPSPKHTIDRINVNKNYTPSNCRWADASEQAKNKRPYGESKYRYVWLHKNKNSVKWSGNPIVNRKRVHLGLFPTELAAHRAVQKYLKSP